MTRFVLYEPLIKPKQPTQLHYTTQAISNGMLMVVTYICDKEKLFIICLEFVIYHFDVYQ